MSPLIQHAQRLREHRRHKEAIAALRQHLAGDPDDFRGHFELALTRLAEGEDHRAALADSERAISLAPDAAVAHAVRSAILNRLERPQDAIRSADDALALDPEMSFAWFCRGNALLEQRRLPEAEDAARKALALDPDDSSASNLLSTVLVCGAIVFLHALPKAPGQKLLTGNASSAFSLALILIMLTTWIGGIRSLRHAAPR